MGWIELILLALALAADAFSVGVVVGLSHQTPRQRFRLSWHFGLFQALLPLAGALLGHLLADVIGHWDRVIACIILVLIGSKMIRDAWCGHDDDETCHDPTRGLSLIGLSLAVSIDAFGAGITLITSRIPLWEAVLLIGFTAGIATLVAMQAAARLSRILGGKAELLGGCVLIGIGLNLLLG